MRRAYRIYLVDMLSSAKKVLTYVSALSKEEFFKDDMRVDAVVPFSAVCCRVIVDNTNPG